MLLLLLALGAQPEPVVETPPAPPPPPPAAPAAPAPVKEERQCTLAVLDLEAGDAMLPARAQALSDVVTGEVGALSKCSVLSRSDIRGILTLEAEKQLMGCASDSCMAELAGALGADYLVTGTISRIEGSLLLSLRITDMKSLKVQRRATDSFVGDDADAIPFVAWLARKIMTDDQNVIGPRPVAAPKVGVVRQGTIWRPVFWTSFTLMMVSGAITGLAGGATFALSEQAKNDISFAQSTQEIGPLVADIANGSLYATGALVLSTGVLFFFPAEEEVKP